MLRRVFWTYCHRAQAYVGAFLRRTPESASELGSELGLDSEEGLASESALANAAGAAASGAGEGSGDVNAAEHLHTIGTFAQVQRSTF